MTFIHSFISKFINLYAGSSSSVVVAVPMCRPVRPCKGASTIQIRTWDGGSNRFRCTALPLP